MEKVDLSKYEECEFTSESTRVDDKIVVLVKDGQLVIKTDEGVLVSLTVISQFLHEDILWVASYITADEDDTEAFVMRLDLDILEIRLFDIFNYKLDSVVSLVHDKGKVLLSVDDKKRSFTTDGEEIKPSSSWYRLTFMSTIVALIVILCL